MKRGCLSHFFYVPMEMCSDDGEYESSDGDSLSVATSVASSVDTATKHMRLSERLRRQVSTLKRTLAEERNSHRERLLEAEARANEIYVASV